MFIERKDIKWEKVKYMRLSETGPAETQPYEYELWLPDFFASWDVFSYWERERTNDMRDNLKPGMVLFDIGAENGWQSVIYSKFVGASNMVLIEPSYLFWPNIIATWEKNGLSQPKASYAGLFSAATRGTFSLQEGWPKVALDKPLITEKPYQYIHDHDAQVPEVELDKFVSVTGIVPDAITMDVEGGEFSILRGSMLTLAEHKPLVWVSVHPDLMQRDYAATRADLLEMMHGLGYIRHHLATDHEEHWAFWHPEGVQRERPAATTAND